MVKNKTAVAALTGKRLITKEVMNYLFEMPAGPPALWTLEKFGYHNITAGGSNRILFAEEYFDLSGYTKQFLTTFPQRITVQEGGSFRLKEDNASPRFGMVVLDLISEEQLTFTNIYDIAQLITDQESAPSFAKGPLEFSQLIYGRYRMFGRDTAIYTPTNGNMTVLNQTLFGSGSPTTAMRLWIYRIIIPFGILAADPDDFLVIPPARYIMSATIAEESDNAFMMRQKKSYELAVND